MPHQVISLPYVDCADFNDVIIQLMDGKNPICYHIEEIDEFELKDDEDSE